MHRISIQFNKTKVLHVVNQTFLSILVYFRIWKFTSLEIYSQTTITLLFISFHWSLSRKKKNRMPQDRRRKEDEQPHCLLPRINVTLCGAAARGERSYSDQREEQKLQTFRTQEEIDLRDQSHKYLFLSSYIAETALLWLFSTECCARFVLFSSIQLELEAAVLL